jgi:urease accessory protein
LHRRQCGQLRKNFGYPITPIRFEPSRLKTKETYMRRLSLFISLLLAPAFALAHPGHLEAGMAAGFMHPFSGFDHLLAMLTVGLWAGYLGGAARWQLPLTFVGVMLLGARLGMAGFTVPWLETGIAASVLVLGLLLTFAAPLTAGARAALVAVFALLHGIAHGAELPLGAHAAGYLLAFAAATVLLHGLGLLMATALPTRHTAIRWIGAVISVAGGALLLG